MCIASSLESHQGDLSLPFFKKQDTGIAKGMLNCDFLELRDFKIESEVVTVVQPEI